MRSHPQPSFRCIGAAFGLLATAGACAGQATFQGLGDLPGGPFISHGYGVSPDGSAAVGWGIAEQGSVPIRWTAANGMEALGSSGSAFAASSFGAVVVGGSAEAFRWTQATGTVGLGLLPGMPQVTSNAYGVSADGGVVVGFSGGSISFQAFRWTAATGMLGLGDLPGGQIASGATGVSADGSVVVGMADTDLDIEAFRWTLTNPATGEGIMVGLGALPGGDGSSLANAVSPDGAVVVGGSSSSKGYEAFRWASPTGMHGLGDLPGGPYSSEAQGASAGGTVVVGGSRDSSLLWIAFVWTPAAGMRDLRQMLTEVHGLNLDGWVLETAWAVSADGRTIVGDAMHNGAPEGWIATIPAYCGADCSVDGQLTVADFICFQSRFVLGDLLYADCSGDGGLTVTDFVCFQAGFVAGCP